MKTEIRIFQIGSDDDELTLEQIQALPCVGGMPDCVVRIADDDVNDEEDFLKAAIDNGYKVYADTEEEILFFVKENL